jgi:hypothetical protein
MSKIPYNKALGSLMYLRTSTRPEISLAIGKVSRKCLILGRSIER